MGSKVHRLRSYNPKPQPINCASINKSANLLAVARGDASIEIWDVKFSPFVLKFIPGVENGSVEALCWVQERLLSTGLGGSLLEWDLETLALKSTTLLTGYAAWCLDVTPDNNLVAVGTEQGYINLFNVENEDIIYQKLFDKQEGRILCCKFNATGDVLATGSVNSIRVWNVKTGQATCRLSVSNRGEEVIVWCLAFLSDNTIISGDSLGRLSFWDSVIGDQTESFVTHKADITTIAVSDDEQNLYCSGVDPTMVHFVRVQDSNTKSKSDPSEQQDSSPSLWAKTVQKHIHEHDVRVIISHGDRQISAGISGYLVFTSFPPIWIMRIPPMIMSPRTAVSASQKLLLLRYSTYFEIWKLGTYAVDESGKAITNTDNIDIKEINKNRDQNKDDLTGKDTSDDLYNTLIRQRQKNAVSLNITEKPTKLLQIHTKHKRQMRCCEISPSGEFIIFATDGHLRMLKMELESEEDEDGDQQRIFLSKLSVHGMKSCDRVSFTADSCGAVAHAPGALHVFQLDADVGATLVHTIHTDKFFSTKAILHLSISNKTQSGAVYLVVADTKCAISVWTLNGKRFEHHCTLPTYHCIPSALSVDSENEVLYVTYVDQKIVEFELISKTFIEWPECVLPKQWSGRTLPFTSVAKHPGRNAVVCQDLNSIWVIEKSQKVALAQNTKLHCKIIPIKYLAGFHWLGKDEAVSIEVTPDNIVSQLPALVATKKH